MSKSDESPPFVVQIIPARSLPVRACNAGEGWYADAYESGHLVINADGDAAEFIQTPPFATIEEAETAMLIARIKGIAL